MSNVNAAAIVRNSYVIATRDVCYMKGWRGDNRAKNTKFDASGTESKPRKWWREVGNLPKQA